MPAASERSPLLTVQNGHSNEIIPNTAPSVDENSQADGAQLERHEHVDEARQRQFQGDGEIRQRMKYILPAVGIGVWMSAADNTIVVSSSAKIGSDLDALYKTQWIATSYLLTLTSFQPLYGKLSDIFGRKETLLLAYAIFGTGCLLCGLAPNMDSLIIARAFAGIGGGGMTTVVSILMSDIVPLKERGMWQGIINLIFALGAGTGAPLGGFLADTLGWRLSFILQAPMALAALVSCYFVLDIPSPDQSHWLQKLRRVDFLGAITLVTAVALLLVGMDRGSNVAWNDTVAITTLSVSIPMFAGFLYIESYIASEPFTPGRVLFGRDLIGAYLCNLFSFAGWYPVLFYIPLYFQGYQAVSATNAGVRLLPGVICSVLGSLAGGFIMRRTGTYYWLNLGGYAILAIAGILLVLFTGGVVDSTPGILLALSIGGLGNGEGVTSSLIALISNAEPADQAVVTANSYLFRSLGCVLGVAIVSTLLQQLLRVKLHNRLSSNGSKVEDIIEKVTGSLAYIKELPPETAEIVRQTYGESIRMCFILVAILLFGSLLSSIFVREKRLSK